MGPKPGSLSTLFTQSSKHCWGRLVSVSENVFPVNVLPAALAQSAHPVKTKHLLLKQNFNTNNYFKQVGFADSGTVTLQKFRYLF